MPVFGNPAPKLMAAALGVLCLLPGMKAAPMISEFMASNTKTIADQDGAFADWVEITNPGPTSANLGGWYLTDKAGNLTKWQIPAVTLAPGGYLVIFCSSKNYTNPAQPLATNFNLAAAGGYVALVGPDGKTVASSYKFPVQYADISYGVTEPTVAGEAPQIGYFATATPGAANGGRTNILLADRVSLSVPPGLFVGGTTVALGGVTGAEHIRYVLAAPSADGDAVAAPTASSALYTGPITIQFDRTSARGGLCRGRLPAWRCHRSDVCAGRQYLREPGRHVFEQPSAACLR